MILPWSDVHRTRVKVLERGLARGGVGVKNAVEDANCSRVGSRGELNDEAVKNGDKVTLINCASLVVLNLVAVLLLSASGGQVTLRARRPKALSTFAICWFLYRN
jgi:hypothetical protein